MSWGEKEKQRGSAFSAVMPQTTIFIKKTAVRFVQTFQDGGGPATRDQLTKLGASLYYVGHVEDWKGRQEKERALAV